MELNRETQLEFSSLLESHHALFSMFWQLGKPVFTEEVDTAAIAFDENGYNIEFLFNFEFWNSLDKNEKLFVVCHECLHVIYNHGLRFFKKSLNVNYELANIATDIVINHTLVNKFGFVRSQLGDVIQNGCWLDTIFPPQDLKNIRENASSEYYYSLLKNDADGGGANSLSPSSSFDDHGFMGGLPEEFVKEMSDGLSKSFSKEQMEKLLDSLGEDKSDGGESGGREAGTGDGSFRLYPYEKPKPKKTWERLIKEFLRKSLHAPPLEKESWVFEQRRMHGLLEDDLYLPGIKEVPDKSKIKVVVFLDTSGSCSSYSRRFLKAARTIPVDKFDLKFYGFTTNVYPVDINSPKLKGGGTAFGPLERQLQNDVDAGDKYPDHVFVITDGWGNKIRPEFPERWLWFMTASYSPRYVPTKSKILQLKDYG